MRVLENHVLTHTEAWHDRLDATLNKRLEDRVRETAAILWEVARFRDRHGLREEMALEVDALRLRCFVEGLEVHPSCIAALMRVR